MKALGSIVIGLLVALSARAAELPSKTDISLLQEVARAQARGLDWLVQQQKEDGSWNNHPAITGLAVTSIARSGKSLTEEQKAAVERGVKFILTNVKPNSAIYGGGETDKYPNYSTAICTMALVATGDPKHHEVIRRARVFLLDSQFDETENVAESDPSWGGVGYGRRQRPDLSNMSWALEALKLTEQFDIQDPEAPQPATKLHWERAVQFLQRCQNLPSHNDQPWAKQATDADLGGFIYMPGFSFVNEEQKLPDDANARLLSQGSMSYAGLKSYIYADLKKNDPRVVAVINWLKRNYTLDENPGMGTQGLFYYLQMMAKAMTAYGADTFTTADGKERDWRYEMLKKFVQTQKADGYWQNENNRFWENDPVLVTTYSLLALEILQQRRYP